MEYTCEGGDMSNSSKNLCPCDKPQWNRSKFTETMQTKFHLLCGNAWNISFSHIMMYTGFLVGAMLFGYLSDRNGRLLSFSSSCLLMALSGSFVSIMPTTTTYTLMRTIEGIGTGGAIITSYVLCIEYIGTKYRELVTALFNIPVNIGHMTLPLISYLLPHCDQFQLAISIPIFFYAFLPWMVMESPRWLLDSGRHNKAIIVMENVAKFNKQPYEDIRDQIEKYLTKRPPGTKTNLKFYQIFRHKTMSLILIYLSIIYFLCGMGYYGVSQLIGKMSGDIHINVAISGALLLPGTISSIFLLKILNRKTMLMFSIFLSGLFMIISVCIPFTYNWIRVIIACICNCFFFISFIVVFLYGVELFPTSVRNSVLGFLSVLSRIGQIVAPLVNTLSENVAGAVFGGFALIGSLFCFLLPETKDTELPSSLEDTKRLTKKVKQGGSIQINSENNT
ncbi:organic cation transporter [Danaus plexippus plexippus]|uniref:Organic cation transporter n=1 Tax=Danaus plexippus plexippus TaxID=278856 RepID=A0A212FEQ0_DANPL|nr:organic cation transporter [Danaus plexippus plexippus]